MPPRWRARPGHPRDRPHSAPPAAHAPREQAAAPDRGCSTRASARTAPRQDQHRDRPSRAQKRRVPEGTCDQLSSGERPAPLHVADTGISPPGANAELTARAQQQASSEQRLQRRTIGAHALALDVPPRVAAAQAQRNETSRAGHSSHLRPEPRDIPAIVGRHIHPGRNGRIENVPIDVHDDRHASRQPDKLRPRQHPPRRSATPRASTPPRHRDRALPQAQPSLVDRREPASHPLLRAPPPRRSPPTASPR